MTDKRAVIVHAHPIAESYSRELRNRVEAGLAAAQWHSYIIDLYTRHPREVTIVEV